MPNSFPGLSTPAHLRSNLPLRLSVLVVICTGGAVWLARDVAAGLRAGRDLDLHRRWIVCQYLARGVNPYPLALHALRRVYGPLGDGREKPRVYAIPRASAAETAAEPLLQRFRTPEAVYPPSADWMLAATVGRLPESLVHPLGMAANLCLLVVCVLLLRKDAAASTIAGMTPIAALLLAWSPMHATVSAAQFSVLVTVCLLLAFQELPRREYLAGVWFAVALLKPSMTLPFLILPLVRGRWRALLVAVGLHGAATCIQAIRFGCSPVELVRQWLQVAAYFTQGQFTLQEVLSSLRWADTAAGTAAIIAFLLGALLWCARYRAASDERIFDWLCFVSVLWTYHGPYDFAVLIVPVARRILGAPANAGWYSMTAFAFFACVSLAASSLIYGDEVHTAARIVRHAARLMLAGGYVFLAVEVMASAHRHWKASELRTSDDVPNLQRSIAKLSA